MFWILFPGKDLVPKNLSGRWRLVGKSYSLKNLHQPLNLWPSNEIPEKCLIQPWEPRASLSQVTTIWACAKPLKFNPQDKPCQFDPSENPCLEWCIVGMSGSLWQFAMLVVCTCSFAAKYQNTANYTAPNYRRHNSTIIGAWCFHVWTAHWVGMKFITVLTFSFPWQGPHLDD